MTCSVVQLMDQGCPFGGAMTKKEQTDLGPCRKEILWAYKVFGICSFSNKRVKKDKAWYCSSLLSLISG